MQSLTIFIFTYEIFPEHLLCDLECRRLGYIMGKVLYPLVLIVCEGMPTIKQSNY